VSAPVTSRREAVRGAALAAGAIAAAGLLRPGAALAQSTDDDDLRDFLATAIAIEQVAVLAYSTAADTPGTDPTLKGTFETFRDQEQAHASALKSALESIGFDAPDAPSSPTDTGVLDDVDGLDGDEATELQDLLGKLDGIKGEAALRLLADLERLQLRHYALDGPGLDSEDLSTTAAEIAGCQAQHLVVVGEQLGDSPAAAVKAAVGAAGATPSGSGGGAGGSGSGSSGSGGSEQPSD